MKFKILSLLIFLLSTSMMAAKGNLDSLYICLDRAIDQTEKYIKIRQERIGEQLERLKAAKALQTKYDCSYNLYVEYSAYKNDSAVYYLNRCIALAQQMKDEAREGEAKALLAFQSSTTGAYVESYSILSRIDTTKLDAAGYRNCLWAALHLYSELSYYSKVPSLQKIYVEKKTRYRNLVMQKFPHDDDRYLQQLEVDYRDAKKYKEALAVNDRRLAAARQDSHQYAIVTFYRALIYKQQNKNDDALWYFGLSALSDVRQAVMDQGSLWELANMLSQDVSNQKRSYDYIRFAWQSAKMFKTSMRSQQMMPVLSSIEEAYQQELMVTNKQLKITMLSLGLLLLLVLGLFAYVNKQRKRLAVAHKALQRSNKELKESNDHLQEAYADLHESNKMKEMYIGRFLRLCATYVDKISTMRKRVTKLVKSREFAKLLDQMNADDGDIDELYEYFDAAFLKLFPNFVDEFNALLKPEGRIVQEEDNKLTTTLRIFALIRLGIEDSSKIAEFLHYSVNTIYNYRAKVKNAALCERETFEDRVRQIGMK